MQTRKDGGWKWAHGWRTHIHTYVQYVVTHVRCAVLVRDRDDDDVNNGASNDDDDDDDVLHNKKTSVVLIPSFSQFVIITQNV